MSFHITENPTSLPYSQPFVTGNGMQHVQRTGTTPQPQDKYELSWLGNNPPHFVHVISNGNTPLSWTNALAIPAASNDDDKSTMPTVHTSGGTTGGDRATELHEGRVDTLAARHPNPQPVSPARSNLSRCSHDEDWGAPPPPRAYYNNDDITSSYSLKLEYLNDPTEPYTEPQQNEAGPDDVPTNSGPAQPTIHVPAATNLPELAITHYDPISHRYTIDNDDVCIDTPAQPPHGGHADQQLGLCHDHGHMLCTVHCLPAVVIRGSSPCDMVSVNTMVEWFCFHCLQVGHWSCQCLTPHVNCHDTNCILPKWHPNFGDHCPIYDPYLSKHDHHHHHCLHTLAHKTAEAAERTLTPKPPTPPPMPGTLPLRHSASPMQA
jgi:hypothetical protein